MNISKPFFRIKIHHRSFVVDVVEVVATISTHLHLFFVNMETITKSSIAKSLSLSRRVVRLFVEECVKIDFIKKLLVFCSYKMIRLYVQCYQKVYTFGVYIVVLCCESYIV